MGHGELLGRLTQIFVETVQGFYVRRAAHEDAIGAKTGAVTAVQRASSDMPLNPHLHTIALDGAWSEQGNGLVFAGLGHLKTSEVGEVLEHAVRRIERHLDRRVCPRRKRVTLQEIGKTQHAGNYGAVTLFDWNAVNGWEWTSLSQPILQIAG